MELIEFNYKEDFAIIDFEGTKKEIQIHPEFTSWLWDNNHSLSEEIIRSGWDGHVTRDHRLSMENLINRDGLKEVGDLYIDFLEEALFGRLFIMKNGVDVN